MRKTCLNILSATAGIVLAMAFSAQAVESVAAATAKKPGMTIVKAAPAKTTRALRAMSPKATAPDAPSAVRTFQDRQLVIPKTRNTTPAKQTSAAMPETSAVPGSPTGSSMPDTTANFEGVGNVSGVLPPDTQGDIGWDPVTGKKYYVQWVNLAYQMWDVTNPAAPVPLLAAPVAGNTLWAGTGGLCEANNDGDPLTRFDPLSNRWVMSQFALSFPNDFHQCIAVSATADPTGEWYLYDFQTSTSLMNDYGKLGIWPDGYYMSFNQFNGSSEAWAGAGVAVFEREKMLLGQSARMIYFDTGSVTLNYGGILPSDLDGPPPPAGTPNYFMEWDDSSWLGDTTDTLRIWEFKTDWVTPANTTFGLNASYDPNYKLSTMDVDPGMCSGNRNCVKQPDTAQGLDPISDRLMYRLQYRNFGTHQTLVGNHTVDADNTDHAGIHWFELRNTGSGFAMSQQGVYAPDADNRWMGSAAMDSSGNIALGYSVSSVTTYPSIRYTGRLAGDPAGTLPQGEDTLIAGGGSQTHTAARWGDYSMLAVDPSDGCTFWYTQEYMQTTGTSNWQTRIGSFKFPSCTTTATGTLSGTVSDGSSLPIAGATVAITGGYLTATDAAGHYTIPLPSGTYEVTVSRYGYLPATTSGVVITAPEPAVRDFTLTVAPPSTISGVVRDTTTNWPLYTRIDISGYPGGPVFTNPVTGAYSVTLIAGSYTFTATAMSGGYLTTAQPVTVMTDAVQDIKLAANLATCTAPGYQTLFTDGFDLSTVPAFSPAWNIADTSGTAGDWVTQSVSLHPAGIVPHSATNMAVFNSWTAGAGESTRLYQTSGNNLSTQTSAELSFWMYHETEYSSSDTIQLQLSTDAGSSWNNVGTAVSRYDGTTGWAKHVVDITAYTGTGMTDVRIGLLATSAFGNDIHIDDVSITNSSGCSPIASGGLVIGAVKDANTGGIIVNATVRDADLKPATMIDASADPATPARLYVIGQVAGPRPLIAQAPSYESGVATPTVIAGSTVGQDIILSAGRLSITPGSLSFHLTKDTPTASQPLSLVNSGGATALYQSFALAGTYVPPVPTGPFAANTRHFGPKNLNDRDARNLRVDLTPTGVAPLAVGTVSSSWPTGLAFAWGIGFNTDATDIWLGNLLLGGGNDLDYRFTTLGVNTGDTIDTSPWATDFAADMAYNPFTKSLWQVNVGGDNCIYELDPAAKSSTGNKICPPFGTSERGLAFDPVSNTYYSGSWNDGIINHFTPGGVILDSKAVGLGISGLAFNPATGHLFVMTSTDNVTDPLKFDIYILDTNDAYAILGGFNLRIDGKKAFVDFAQAALDLDCSGNLWAVDQAAQKVYVAPSGETGVCDWQAAWLSMTPASGSVTAGSTAPLTAHVDVSNLQEGTHTAYFKVTNTTPYGPVIVPVTVTIDSKLTVTKEGTGSGTVISTQGSINCGTACSDYFSAGTVVSLTAVPATFSSFMGWGGDPDCADGMVTLDTSKSCNASFAITPLRAPDQYGTIQAAYDAVLDNGTIQTQVHTFEEEVLCARLVTVKVSGGYSTDFTTTAGMTTIKGKLTVRGGKVVVSRLIIQKPLP